MAKSAITITFDQSRKTLSVTGLASVRETVEVTVVNGAVLIDEGLVLKIQDKSANGEGTPIAKFPLEDTDAWTTNGLNAKCDLNLNTNEAVAAFTDALNTGCLQFNVLLYTMTTKALVGNGFMSVMNFPSNVATEPSAVTDAGGTSYIVGLLASFGTRLLAVESDHVNVLHKADFDGLESLPLTSDKERTDAITAVIAKARGL